MSTIHLTFLLLLLPFLSLAFTHIPTDRSHADDTRLADAAVLEWPSAVPLYDADEVDADDDGALDRRSLFWRTMRYYISYGALSANRIPCPPRSGRSYYSHNCFKSRGPVHPYSRGCSAITRCRR